MSAGCLRDGWQVGVRTSRFHHLAPEAFMAGYSGTPLPKKLGIKEGLRIAFLDAPAAVRRTLGDLPHGARASSSIRGTTSFDIILLFVRRSGELRRRFGPAAKHLDPAGMLWIAWPKKASKVPTDLTDNVVRQVGLDAGLVDVKVCAIDDTWSGLKFVRRLADRPKT